MTKCSIGKSDTHNSYTLLFFPKVTKSRNILFVTAGKWVFGKYGNKYDHAKGNMEGIKLPVGK